MVPDQQRLTPEERVNLVAYLDNELNEAERRAIATKLTQSMTARRELEVLEKTWQLLDHLPRPKASEDFTARTLVGVEQLNMRGDQVVTAISSGVQKLLASIALVAASALVFLIGHLIVAWAWPNPTARLVRDLSIAENLEPYQDVQTVDFLEFLDKSPEFNNDSN